MHGRVQLAVADTGPALACTAMPLALPACGLPRLRCCHAACCEQQVPIVPCASACSHASLRSGGHPGKGVAVCEFPPSRARPLGCLTATASEPYVSACPPRVLDARGARLRP